MLVRTVNFCVWLLQPVFRAFPKTQFVAALTVAAVNDSWEKVKGIKEAMGAKQAVPDVVKQARLVTCPNCPIYFAPLGTCGSPLLPKPKFGIPRGCFCHLEAAAGTRHDCWLFEHPEFGYDAMRGHGWAFGLNSSVML